MLNRKLFSIIFIAASLGLSVHASAAPLSSGTLDPDDPIWNGTGTGFPGYYDVVTFTVDNSGLYSFDADYPLANISDPASHLDGLISLKEGGFDPSDPFLFEIAFNDDGPTGSTSSQIADIALTAGTTYFMIITSYDHLPSSFGQPIGDWNLSGTGEGNITVSNVPVPAALWLFVSGLLGMGAFRRQS
ncbi:MAG: VPLPA-CTERM sorting domain-containing protein [Gammaproteobacteria bacterium]|nr:VPLPA-CTERM sorting domain-containing protein [Gammaproteobacteria bacterium]